MPQTASCPEGQAMHDFARALFPLPRSLTGEGTRETLRQIQAHLPGMQIHEVPSGTSVFDWEVPPEWNVRSARLIGPDGEVIADFDEHNLHLVGYSEPVDREIEWEELEPRLYSLPDQPTAIPYITSYYNRHWGFCLTDEVKRTLGPGTYRVEIDSELKPGSLSYGEWIWPGETEEEVFLSTYVCHPSMANNELSGPAVTTWIGKWLQELPRRYTYRIVFIPETIGSITYLSRNADEMKRKVVAGFNVSCIGDDRVYSYLPSRAGDTVSDRAGRHVLGWIDPDYIRYSYLDRGSDERQYCAPGIDLPVASVMRSKYGEYPEYHTSLDDLDLVTPSGLQGGYDALKECIEVIEANGSWRVTVLGEPQLGKRGLYPTISTVGGASSVRTMMDLIAYSDGTRDLIEVADTIGARAKDLIPIYDRLENHGLMERVS